jgi:hypothetical protein
MTLQTPPEVASRYSPSADILDPQPLAFYDDHLFGGLKNFMGLDVVPQIIPVASDHLIYIVVEPVFVVVHDFSP